MGKTVETSKQSRPPSGGQLLGRATAIGSQDVAPPMWEQLPAARRQRLIATLGALVVRQRNGKV